MSIKSDLNSFQLILLFLFGTAILVGLIYVGLGTFEGTLCTQADADWTYQNGQCLNETGDPQTVASIDRVNQVQSGILIVLGLLGLFVLIAVFAIIFKTVKGMMGKNM